MFYNTKTNIPIIKRIDYILNDCKQNNLPKESLEHLRYILFTEIDKLYYNK